MAETPRRRALLGAALLAPAAARAAERSAFDFAFTALEGGPLPLAAFRGRVLLVVNTASFCGFTPQYAALQRLHDRFEARGLVVLGVPSNDFNQESTDARRVREFCDTMFGITFPMAGLTHVRGANAHPFFAWAAERAGPVRWNFHKYLVARDGRRVTGFATRVAPDAPELLRAIEQALSAPAGA
ncbi:glutathione peroxidase [Rubritepida flocculans]|uniref:glutathione peroxidase n=1 Tax=Rubritepida flocculans TaxID=182403 RepID=UPI00040FBCED|nr:glutathione peroxidase [Rubritepida flocculans]